MYHFRKESLFMGEKTLFRVKVLALIHKHLILNFSGNNSVSVCVTYYNFLDSVLWLFYFAFSLELRFNEFSQAVGDLACIEV